MVINFIDGTHLQLFHLASERFRISQNGLQLNVFVAIIKNSNFFLSKLALPLTLVLLSPLLESVYAEFMRACVAERFLRRTKKATYGCVLSRKSLLKRVLLIVNVNLLKLRNRLFIFSSIKPKHLFFSHVLFHGYLASLRNPGKGKD